MAKLRGFCHGPRHGHHIASAMVRRDVRGALVLTALSLSGSPPTRSIACESPQSGTRLDAIVIRMLVSSLHAESLVASSSLIFSRSRSVTSCRNRAFSSWSSCSRQLRRDFQPRVLSLSHDKQFNPGRRKKFQPRINMVGPSVRCKRLLRYVMRVTSLHHVTVM